MTLVIGMLTVFFVIGLTTQEISRRIRQQMITAIIVIIAITFIRGAL